MRILQIFNRYAYVGGEELAVNQITAELEVHHQLRCITFDSASWSKAGGIINRLKQTLAMAWNPSAISHVRREIEEFQPQLILLHNIMPVGSGGLYVFLTSLDIPVVQYVHNFRPFSVNGYCWGKGKLITGGLRKNFLPEILAGSWQNSRIKTAWYGTILWFLHQWGIFSKIDGWIAISHFMKQTFVEAGIAKDRIEVISHSWIPQCDDADSFGGNDEQPMFLFLGRLTEEKGLCVLLRAWEKLEQTCDRGELVIAGDGPLSEEVASRCQQLQRVRFVGFKTGREKRTLLEKCSALIVPSIWWEPLGLVLYEAYDFGKPVLAARSGGILDHVQDGVTGWLHDPGDISELTKHMEEAIQSPAILRQRGANGRKKLLERSSQVWIHEFNQFIERIVDKTAASKKSLSRAVESQKNGSAPVSLKQMSVYLADQNPGYDRSFGISRMSQAVLQALAEREDVEIQSIVSSTSQRLPRGCVSERLLPWGTRGKLGRFLTDHLHPLFPSRSFAPDIFYFPKGFLPFLYFLSRPSVVTIHDTIIQYDEDHFPQWRSRWEYGYWAMMLKHTLRRADRIMTVSESSRNQILAFMKRHRLPTKEVAVTYEPCMYESIPQPEGPIKENFVIHLASCEPHKMTSLLIRWWHEAEKEGRDLPMLHLIGSVPSEVAALLASSRSIVKRPFLEDEVLQVAYREAKALILPSAIEGFGLPALEAYYLGTPVCYVKGTSVEEVLGVATSKGGFVLDDPQSLFDALDEVIAMDAAEVKACGMVLRDTYAAAKVAERMMAVFQTLQESR